MFTRGWSHLLSLLGFSDFHHRVDVQHENHQFNRCIFWLELSIMSTPELILIYKNESYLG